MQATVSNVRGQDPIGAAWHVGTARKRVLVFRLGPSKSFTLVQEPPANTRLTDQVQHSMLDFPRVPCSTGGRKQVDEERWSKTAVVFICPQQRGGGGGMSRNTTAFVRESSTFAKRGGGGGEEEEEEEEEEEDPEMS
ncbi:hypothetical protein ARMGADRAFT_1070537 [Armillaria gallica]|uniref:Uncharacterized protein n=1 Tax=Armillaria gallica TaxID=47427 RepID=A0A2H3ECQ2_ARMGA|nr:hypothetical protein ARMGADRAFT_1070537 [Armillaria gallica]